MALQAALQLGTIYADRCSYNHNVSFIARRTFALQYMEKTFKLEDDPDHFAQVHCSMCIVGDNLGAMYVSSSRIIVCFYVSLTNAYDDFFIASKQFWKGRRTSGSRPQL